MTRPASPDEPMQPVGGTISSGEPSPAARADVPSEELGTTGQFKAFANGEDTGAAERAASRPASERAAREATSGYAPMSSESTGTIQPPGLPPVRSDSKRGLYLALAVVVLVAIVITVLLLVL
ncbi:hypothetical protein EK0264_03320 [Epidermidibacterium keratini]|uniref:Uncharacterized protein n=1 Tax=Epidermidibacterium keratini TaxID=1891644 RepID=A0A7L4YLH3_9ACTN|nr:hypothetical protein [Epidermidibacterium keratini]QHB99406.1 hypothetical protein EK0264_03320 [Epidermidibacterium keratini]